MKPMRNKWADLPACADDEGSSLSHAISEMNSCGCLIIWRVLDLHFIRPMSTWHEQISDGVWFVLARKILNETDA